MQRTADAVWHGTIKEGRGEVSTQSGVLSKTPYSFTTRFESGQGTNPEELIAAAHAGCFTMALSGQLTQAGLKPERLSTKATLSFEKVEDKWTVTRIHLEVNGSVPGTDAAGFQKLADAAKVGCPISRLLKAEITMDAKLAS